MFTLGKHAMNLLNHLGDGKRKAKVRAEIDKLLNHLGDGKRAVVATVATATLLNHLGDGKLSA